MIVDGGPISQPSTLSQSLSTVSRMTWPFVGAPLQNARRTQYGGFVVKALLNLGGDIEQEAGACKPIRPSGF